MFSKGDIVFSYYDDKAAVIIKRLPADCYKIEFKYGLQTIVHVDHLKDLGRELL